ncbi:MAG TPA: hypothetical protein ENI62_14255 [Gammaproteobacteria bacterium]|nr:hypothetical protein [Gammaproteobacteria bacterium]
MTPNELTIEKFFLILQMRTRLIAGILAAAVIIAGVITYLTPKMYEATTSLNFTFRANPVDSRGTELAEQTYVATQIGIIESQQVAQRVVDSLTDYQRERLIAALDARYSVIDDLISLLKSPVHLLFSDEKSSTSEQAGPGNGDSLEISSAYGWLAQGLGGTALTVDPKLNTRIVQIAYESTDPQIAALMVNKIAEAYITANLEMVTDPARKSKVWFNEQLKSLRKQLEEAQSRLTTYQQQEGVVFTDARLDTETARLQNLSGQLVNAQQATRNAVTEREKLQEVLASGVSLTTFEPVFGNTVVQTIKAKIRDLQGALVSNSNSLGANHPKIVKLKSELYAARQRLNAEIETITDGIDNAAELSREREHDLEKSLAAQKQLVLGLKNEHNNMAVLQREVESTQATYNAALKQLNTTSMQSMVDQTNVSIVDRANIPGSPSSPRVTMNLMLGMLGGLILGIGLAVVLEMFVRRVHSLEDLTTELGVPLLAHLKKV